jgi:lactate dehydrogenase-like 2-hydroxyacid dehydrogenase
MTDFDTNHTQPNYKVLIIDLIGMTFDASGEADYSEVAAYIRSLGCEFHLGMICNETSYQSSIVHFFYQPNLSRADEILEQTSSAQFEAVIAAATFIPSDAIFNFGGVRIGAGTGNMGANSWGAGNGIGAIAPLMNTPSFNSRATAQAAFKALLSVLPDLAVDEMHQLVVQGNFDTGKDLAKFPTSKLEGKKLAVIGYGNIGREVAKLGKAFGMNVCIYARKKHQIWIKSEGFEYANSIIEAAKGADVLSPHTGLGTLNPDSGRYTNANIINDEVFSVMNHNSVLINYDRGEVVDINALDRALSSGKIRFATIDADIFKNPATQQLSGPMLPYYNIYHKHSSKMQLLPHAAADTEHVSRVEGAKQAVDQILQVILDKKVTNLVGDLPAGYNNGGAKTVKGVGKVVPKDINSLTASQIQMLKEASAVQTNFWQTMASATVKQRDQLISKHGADFLLNANAYTTLLAEYGLQGPFENE